MRVELDTEQILAGCGIMIFILVALAVGYYYGRQDLIHNSSVLILGG